MLVSPTLTLLLSQLFSLVIVNGYYNRCVEDNSINEKLYSTDYQFMSKGRIVKASLPHQFLFKYQGYNNILPRGSSESGSHETTTRSTSSYEPPPRLYTNSQFGQPSSSATTASLQTQKTTFFRDQAALLKSEQSSRRKPNTPKRLADAPRKLPSLKPPRKQTRRRRPRKNGKGQHHGRPSEPRLAKAEEYAKEQPPKRLVLLGNAYKPGSSRPFEVGSAFKHSSPSGHPSTAFLTLSRGLRSSRSRKLGKDSKYGHNRENGQGPWLAGSPKHDDDPKLSPDPSQGQFSNIGQIVKASQRRKQAQPDPEQTQVLQLGQSPNHNERHKFGQMIKNVQGSRQNQIPEHFQEIKQAQRVHKAVQNPLRFNGDLHIHSPVQFQQDVEVHGHLRVNAPTKFDQHAQVHGSMDINAPTEFYRGTQIYGPTQFNAPTLFRGPPKQTPPKSE